MNKKLFKAAVWVSIAAFMCLGILYLSGAAYPDLTFKILQPLFLILIVISLALLVMAWISSIYIEVKNKNYLIAFIWFLAGIILIVFKFIK